ncbi:NAD-binding Rossmann fold oxidoreductase family protein [Patellaria atrata CBS 101060]|uniref:NAD-binding Rossmann fold oxidoreductase family protein n=1 Tax=Patellaria atrata CBS 101060 TaxID=1346257 RepID=A0A9P4S4F3_9PEZI|nr:NAD-binding Rossmann fold oxidoreductase family protein [Patellaria atrata CBS 101060]
MAPIRVGFIGASVNSWAARAHIPYLKNTSKYKVVALLNTSVEAAHKAIEHFQFPSTTKAYGDPKDLANDPDVDLVVCSVRVDRHYETILPALQAGKDVFCEWPLGKNISESEELSALAKKKGVKTMIGLQGEASLSLNKIKELIQGGAIGKVFSTTVVAVAAGWGPNGRVGYEYLNDIEIGGTMVSIAWGHLMDVVLYVLGDGKELNSILDRNRTEIPMLDSENKHVATMKRTTHDQIMVQGRLESGALLSYHLRGGNSFPGTPVFDWRIYGEKGEIRLTASTSMVQVISDDVVVQLHKFGGGEAETVDFKDDTSGLFPEGTGRLYEAFASGKKESYPDWDLAMKRHRMIDNMYNQRPFK